MSQSEEEIRVTPEVVRELRHSLACALGLLHTMSTEAVFVLPGASEGPPMDVADVKRHMRSRRIRESLFPKGFFADPAWDMLLELYSAALDGRKLAINRLSVAANVPLTTTLRWIGTLEKEALVNRESDHLDGRRIYVNLTAKGMAAMEACFRADKCPKCTPEAREI